MIYIYHMVYSYVHYILNHIVFYNRAKSSRCHATCSNIFMYSGLGIRGKLGTFCVVGGRAGPFCNIGQLMLHDTYTVNPVMTLPRSGDGLTFIYSIPMCISSIKSDVP